jgi:hypothetical protein
MRVTLLVLLAGCAANFSYRPLEKAPHATAPRAPAAVELFTSGAPSRPFVEVGLFKGEYLLGPGYTTWTDDPDLLRRVRKQAGERGCDGLLVAGGDTNGVRATCVVFR